MKNGKTIQKTVILLLILSVLTGFVMSCKSTGDKVEDNTAVLAFERAEAQFRTGNFNEAIAEYTRAIEISPQWTDAYLMRGYVHGWNGDLDLCYEDYKAAAALDSKYQDFSTAFGLFKDKKYSEAIVIYNRINPNNINMSVLYNLRGVSFYSIGDIEKAIADYDAGILLVPDFFGHYLNRAFAYNDISLFDMAIADCNKAMELAPEYFLPYAVRANAYFGKGDFTRSLSDSNRAIQLNPDNKGTNASLPYNIRAVINIIQNNHSSAITDLSKAIELYPEGLWNYLNRAECYIEMGLFNNAMTDINTVLRLEPGNEKALYLRSLITP